MVEYADDETKDAREAIRKGRRGRKTLVKCLSLKTLLTDPFGPQEPGIHCVEFETGTMTS
jgi:hypothetical protein